MVSTLSHIREIERVGMGAVSPRDAPVIQSWLRCLNDYKLDPAVAQEAYIVPELKLREHREQAEELIRIGRSGLEALFNQVAGQNYVLLLSDARGVTVDFMGDPTFDNQLRKAGLYLGSEWSENRAAPARSGPAWSPASLSSSIRTTISIPAISALPAPPRRSSTRWAA